MQLIRIDAHVRCNSSARKYTSVRGSRPADTLVVVIRGRGVGAWQRRRVEERHKQNEVVGAHPEDSAARGVNGGALDVYLTG